MSVSFDNVDTSKYSFLPVENPELHRFYEVQRDALWTTSEIDFSKDPVDWKELPENVRSFITFILAFFSQADGIVVENLMHNFQEETSDLKDAVHFYAAQNLIEVIHGETYSTMLHTLIENLDERSRALDAIKNYPIVGAIGEWMVKWMDTSIPLMERIVAFCCVEGIVFSGAFCAIYWIKKQYKDKLRGLCKSNEFIARDETLHTMFGVALYHTYTKKLKQYPALEENKVHEIVGSAVDLSINFIKEALQCRLVGMNSDKMITYVKCTADVLLDNFGCKKLYDASNPFPWMIMLGLENKTNFFEDTVAEYKKVSEEDWGFSINEDF